jgi:hypothetical protein
MASSCCATNYMNTGAKWVVGSLKTPEGAVDQIRSRFDWRDRLSWWRVRWGMGRMAMAVRPGLYALNTPTAESEVFVTANYKMSFDHLRHSLGNRNAWVLVLDTQGINVWCAAGKGSFGTEELTARIMDVGLARVVSHNRLILPQFGAVGVDAGAVSAQVGFRVLYGPVRAADIPAYLDAGREATETMRRVTFTMMERAVLVPVEIINAGKFLLPTMVALFLLSGVYRGGFSVARMLTQGGASVAALAAAWLGGAVLGPLLLPALPGRMLALKGAVAAALALLGVQLAGGFSGEGLLAVVGFWLAMPAIASFIMMNFTGATPYTSPSGVRKEMKVSVPVQAVCAAIGVVLWVSQRFVVV